MNIWSSILSFNRIRLTEIRLKAQPSNAVTDNPERKQMMVKDKDAVSNNQARLKLCFLRFLCDDPIAGGSVLVLS
jgi:hypothetical protein